MLPGLVHSYCLPSYYYYYFLSSNGHLYFIFCWITNTALSFSGYVNMPSELRAFFSFICLVFSSSKKVIKEKKRNFCFLGNKWTRTPLRSHLIGKSDIVAGNTTVGIYLRPYSANGYMPSWIVSSNNSLKENMTDKSRRKGL